MNLPNSTIDLENNILDVLTLSYNKILNSAKWLGANIAQLASYTSGSWTITLPSNFTHILIIMGWGGWGGGGSDWTWYGAGGWGGGALIIAMRAKEELTWTSLSYMIWNWGSGWTAWNPWSSGSATILTGSGVNLTAWQWSGGHKWASWRDGWTWVWWIPITQLPKDIWINWWDGTSYFSWYADSSSIGFYWMCRWGMKGSESGMQNTGWWCAGVPKAYIVYQQYQHYLDWMDWTGCGGGGAYGGIAYRWGNWWNWFLRIYYFYN